MFNFFKKSRARQIIDKYNQGIKLTEEEKRLVSIDNLGRIMDKIKQGEALTDEEADVITEMTRERLRSFYGSFYEGIIFKLMVSAAIFGAYVYYSGGYMKAFSLVAFIIVGIPIMTLSLMIMLDHDR